MSTRLEVDQIIEATVGLASKEDELLCTILHKEEKYEVVLYKKQGDWYYMTVDDYREKLQAELENEHDVDDYVDSLTKVEYQVPLRLEEIIRKT
jgi:hypothetical protein